MAGGLRCAVGCRSEGVRHCGAALSVVCGVPLTGRPPSSPCPDVLEPSRNSCSERRQKALTLYRSRLVVRRSVVVHPLAAEAAHLLRECAQRKDGSALSY